MKLKLKAKAILLIISISLLIGIAGIIIFNKSITDLTVSEYESRSVDLASAVAQFAEIENTEVFNSLREQLRKIQDVIDVDCVYITWYDSVGGRYLYLVDAAYEDVCPPGAADPLYFDDPEIIANLASAFPPNITNTEEYGYLLSAGMPIHTDDGELVGYGTVDILMNDIIAKNNHLLLLSLLVFGGITIVAILIGIYGVDKTIVNPINKLSEAAIEYQVNDLRFQDIDIHTGDEIENLSNSMKQMERDIKDYYDNLMTTRSDLAYAKKSAATYKREAIVDPLTGVRNKRGYDISIANVEENQRDFAIAMIDLNDLKLINDKYGHDKGDIAIQTLSKLICDVFKHSSVFRVGGDEFVVIMLNEDYEFRETVIGHFRDEVRKIQNNKNLKPWEKIAAAIGYSVYDKKKDKNANSVLKRADDNMYENKTKMKNKD